MKNKYSITTLILLLVFPVFLFAQKTEIDSLKRVLQQTKVDTAKANIFNHISNNFKEINPDSTLFYANKALQISLKNNYAFGLANSYINSGNANIILGNYKNASSFFNKAQTTYSKLLENDSENKTYKNGLARAYASLGVVYTEQENNYAALENYQKALELYKEIGQKSSICKAYNNIGIVYKTKRENAKALEYFKKALQLQTEIGEQSVPVTLTNIGAIYFEENNLEEAFSYYSKAQKAFEKIENPRGLALLYNYLGDYYQIKNNPELAISNYNESLKINEEMQNKFGASLALYNLGEIYKEQKNYISSLNYATKSLTYAKEIGVLDQTYHSEKLLSEIYELQNNQKQSLEHYKNYIVARDSLMNLENNKKFVRAEMDFEYQKKEALLHEKSKRQTLITIFSIIGTLLLLGLIFVIFNRRQVKRRLTLQKEVAEYEQKALHLQMNPHFVFNCLGSISSFIVQNGTDSALKYLSKFSKLMRLTLEYSKGSLIPIDKEIESLQNYLELEQLRFHNIFQFSITATENVEFNMGIPPLLIQPFAENAILHGLVPKEKDGQLDINFDVQNGQLICTIKDNGIGFSKSKEIKENSVKAHQSMALDITKKRLEIMEQTISKSAQIEIKENNGTIVILRLPIQYMQ